MQATSIRTCSGLWFALPCALMLALSVTVLAQGNSDNVPAPDAEEVSPPRVTDPFEDLYPDVDLADADRSAGEDPSLRGVDVSAEKPADAGDEIPADDSSGRTGPEDARGDTSGTEDPLADLYPDTELPDAESPGAGEEDLADLYPDRKLPESVPPKSDLRLGPFDRDGDGKIDSYPLAGEPPAPGEAGESSSRVDTAMIEELLGGVDDSSGEGDSSAPPELRRPRDLLALFDPPIDESQLRSFVDGDLLVPGEEETLTRILYRLPRFSLDQIHRWLKRDVPWEDLVREPDFFRAEFFDVPGRVREIVRVKVIPEIADRLQFDHYYRVRFEIDHSPYQAVVCTRNLPNAWIRAQKEGRELNERAGFSGMFLKVGGGQDGAEELVFATRRLAWYPDREDEDWGVSQDDVFLGDLGMDVGLFELVTDGGSINQDDREGFYQLLDAVGRTTREQLEGRAAASYDIAKMLVQPKTQRGRLMSLVGNARRVTKIPVSDPDVRERFGITHYYEMAVFVALDTRIEIPVGEGKPPKRFDNDFPIIFCVRQVPEGMPRGPDIRESVPVRIPAFYFKLYAYRSQYMSGQDRSLRQPSPLLVGLEPDWIVSEQQTNPWFSVMLGGLFIVAVAGIWFGLWRYSRADRKFERTTLARQFALSEGESLDEMGIEARGGPDFSGLDAASDGPDPAGEGNGSPKSEEL